MKPEEFSLIVEKIRPFTNYIYLHVLGEPLQHPQLEEILKIAKQNKLNVNLTTNGTLLAAKKEILLNHSIRQVNISLHSAEENIDSENYDNYLDSVLEYALSASKSTYISLRLWNSGVESSVKFNQYFLEKISEKFNITNLSALAKNKKTDIKLSDHIFLQSAPRFEWPDGLTGRTNGLKTCYALRDHIAILSDGSIVPCCLDADANLKLGNIFTDNLDEVLNSPKAVAIKKGFEQHKIVESFCKTCGFIIS